MNNTASAENIWIIGASSGIGLALAKAYDQLGANLILSARNQDALFELASECQQAHALPLDIANIERIKATVDNLAAQNALPDRIIIMAATYQPGNISQLSEDDIINTVNVNLTGVIYLVRRLLPHLQARGSGQIAICASVAGYIGLPSGQPYSCTKAALINFTECLKAELYKSPIDIKLINPGFVKTRLTDKNTFPMPFIIEADTAAQRIIKGLNSKRFEVHFPKKLTYIMKFLRILPYWVLLPILGRMDA